MTTPEIDGSPSTVEGGDKPGANSPVDAAPPKDPMTEIEDEVARVEKERNEAQDGWFRLRQEVNLPGGLRDRLAAAESSLERMRERVAGLAEEWEQKQHEAGFQAGFTTAYRRCARALRSLENASSPSTPETKDDHR